MGKVLIIKDADFSANAIEIITPESIKLNPTQIVENKYISTNGDVGSGSANIFKILLYAMETGKTYKIIGSTPSVSQTSSFCTWGVFSDTVPTAPASPHGVNTSGGGVFTVNETIIGETGKYIGLNYTFATDGGPGSTGQGTIEVHEVIE